MSASRLTFMRALTFPERFYVEVLNIKSDKYQRNKIPKDLDKTVNRILTSGLLVDYELILLKYRLNDLLSYEKIANILGTDISNVSSNYYKLIDKLKDNPYIVDALRYNITMLNRPINHDFGIEYLNLSKNIREILNKKNINTIGDLCNRSYNEIKSIRCIGDKYANTILEHLNNKGFILNNESKSNNYKADLSEIFSAKDLSILNKYNIKNKSDLKKLLDILNKYDMRI